MRAFKVICIDNPLGQNTLFEAKMGIKLITVASTLLKWGYTGLDVGVFRNFFGTLLAFSVNFITRNKTTQLVHFNLLATHSPLLDVVFRSDRYIRLLAIFFHNCVVWNPHIMRHAFLHQYGTQLFKRFFQHLVLAPPEAPYTAEINEWFTFTLVHLLRSSYPEDAALKAQEILIRQMSRQGSPSKLPFAQREALQDSAASIHDDDHDKDIMSNAPPRSVSREGSPSPTHPPLEDVGSDAVLSRLGTGIP